jgi:hypothetical protein
LPVPQQNSLVFCDQLDTSVVDDLGKDLIKITKIGIVILIIVALLMLLGNCALEWYKWRCLKQHLQYTREAWTTDPTLYYKSSMNTTPEVKLTDHNLLMLQASSQHPLLTRIANQLTALLRLSPSQHTNLQWFFHYVFHPPALACFLIGFFGLLSVELQLLAIHPLEAKYQAQAVSTVNDFSNTIAASMNASMYNQSALYANDINSRVDAVQSTINDGLFGWVNGTTTTLNDTLNTFYSDIQDAVSTVFNGTILENPVQDFIKCFIGSKVDALEDALTFLHNNLNVDMPRVNDSVLVLSPAQVDEATKPIAAAAIGGGNDDNEGLVGRLVNSYVSSLKKERIMFAVFMGLWGVVVLIALGVILWHSYGKGWLEARRRRKWQEEQRGGLASFALGSGIGPKDVVADEKGGMQSFAPPFPEPNPNPFTVVRSPREERAPPIRRSSESFFDDQDRPTGSRFTISPPQKLMAIGRKAIGRERSPADAEQHAPASPVLEHKQTNKPQTPGWLRPLVRMFSRSGGTDDDAASDTSRESFRERRPPHLTISTEHGAPDGNLPAIDRSVEPRSAWSVSPGPSAALPPTLPWTQNIIPSPPPPGLYPVTPLEPKPRRKVSVPENVDSTPESEPDLTLEPSTSQPQVRFVAPLPIHHAFSKQPQEASPPPVTSPVAAAPLPWAINSLAPPPDRHRTDQPQVTFSADPFSTPFDDEHAINTARMSFNRRQSKPTNPFIGGFAI